jgi:putative addiction module CopG family antidote
MTLSLPPHVLAFIDDRVKAGKYPSAEDVIVAAIASLEQQEQFGDFEPGELDRLIEEGENSGPPLDGEQVLTELRELRQRGQSKAG